MVQWNPQSSLSLPLILHHGFAVLSVATAAALAAIPRADMGGKSP
jgi:hypothetical protein